MGGKQEILAAAMLCALGCAMPAAALEPPEPAVTAFEWELESALDNAAAARPAGTVVRNKRWTARLSVNHFGQRASPEAEGLRLRAFSTVGAQASVRLDKTARVSLDLFNVFDRRVGGFDEVAASRLWGASPLSESYLVHPAEPRGMRLRFTKTFR